MTTKKIVNATGLTVLYEPEDSYYCSADVVFVHGIQGHPRRTWTTQRRFEAEEPERFSTAGKKSMLATFKKTFNKSARGASGNGRPPETAEGGKNAEVFWPEEILPNDCSSARIMTFGYDSHVSRFFGGPVNQNTFYEHGRDLLAELDRKRRDVRGRPLLFVAHSLGGIIVKQALYFSKRDAARREIKDILDSTEVVFFLGTPHRGSNYAAWGKVAENVASVALFDTNEKIIGELRVHGEELARLASDFGTLVADRTFDIYSYQEAKGLKGVQGLHGKVVDSFSSTVGDLGREHIETINANHMDMCRYASKDDPGYQQVGMDITHHVKKSFSRLKSEQKAEREGILDLLTTVDLSFLHVPDPYEDTAIWLFEDPRFLNWWQKEHGIFWLKGKPGSGKSTLLKAMWLTLQNEPLRLDQSRNLVVAFFFNSRGSAHECSFIDMLRTILLQILMQSDAIYKALLPEIRTVRKDRPSRFKSSRDFDVKTLAFFIYTAVKLARDCRLFFFIDALDECQREDRGQVISFVEKLASVKATRYDNLDILVSSRHETTIDIQAGRYLTLENENHRDIVPYVERELISRGTRRRATNPYHELGQKVIEKADGVFLWVHLVIPRLREHIGAGDTLTSLLKILDDIPSKLEALFHNILERISSENLHETIRMLRLAIFCERPLELEEFRHAFALGAGFKDKSLDLWMRSSDFIEQGEQIKLLIQSRSGGLLEVRRQDQAQAQAQSHAVEGDSPLPGPELPQTNKETVFLIHETAKHFFMHGSGFTLITSFMAKSQVPSQSLPSPHDESNATIHQGAGHDYVGRTCMSYLTIPDLLPWTNDVVKHGNRMFGDHSTWKAPRDIVANFPFVNYATNNWLAHLEQAEAQGVSQLHMCKTILAHFPKADQALLALASKANLISWLTWLKEDNIIDFDTAKFAYGLPMRLAVANRNAQAIEILVSGGANVNATTGGFDTSLRAAMCKGYQEIVALLLSYGATPSQVHWIPDFADSAGDRLVVVDDDADVY